MGVLSELCGLFDDDAPIIAEKFYTCLVNDAVAHLRSA